MPEKQAEFASAWGGRGPSSFDTALRRLDEDPALGPSGTGEALTASLAEELREAATERLPVAHDQWEADLLAQLRGVDVEEADDARHLAVLGGVANLLRGASDDLSEPSDHAQRYWYAKTTDSERIDRALEEALAALDRFAERLRTSLALASAVASSRSLSLQQRGNAQSQRSQRVITALGSLVLGPTLVVGFFGANVPVPLADSQLGFFLMVVLMIVSALLIWGVLRSLQPKPEKHPRAPAAGKRRN